MNLSILWSTIQAHGLASAGAGFALGLAAANYALMIRWVVNSSFVMAAIRKNPALAKAIVAELQKDVNAVADAPAPAPAAPPAANP